MYKIVFFDIDGTILDHEKKIPESTKEAVKKLKESGIEVVIATGRANLDLQQIAHELQIDSYVCFNGGMVVHKGDIIYKSPMEPSFVNQIDRIAENEGHSRVYLSLDQYYSKDIEHPQVKRIYKEYVNENDPIGWRNNAVFQLALFCSQEEEKYYEHLFKNISFYRWMHTDIPTVDVVPKENSKAIGIEKMLGVLNIDCSEAVAFGDGTNDLEMLMYVGMGVAMGNGCEELKEVADFVTKDVSEDGIAYALTKLGLI